MTTVPESIPDFVARVEVLAQKAKERWLETDKFWYSRRFLLYTLDELRDAEFVAILSPNLVLAWAQDWREKEQQLASDTHYREVK